MKVLTYNLWMIQYSKIATIICIAHFAQKSTNLHQLVIDLNDANVKIW